MVVSSFYTTTIRVPTIRLQVQRNLQAFAAYSQKFAGSVASLSRLQPASSRNNLRTYGGLLRDLRAFRVGSASLSATARHLSAMLWQPMSVTMWEDLQ